MLARPQSTSDGVALCWGAQLFNKFDPHCYDWTWAQSSGALAARRNQLHSSPVTMSRHRAAAGGGKKRKAAQAGPAARGSRAGKPAKKVKRASDTFYEAMDSDPDEEKHADRYDVSAAAWVTAAAGARVCVC